MSRDLSKFDLEAQNFRLIFDYHPLPKNGNIKDKEYTVFATDVYFFLIQTNHIKSVGGLNDKQIELRTLEVSVKDNCFFRPCTFVDQR